MKILYGTTNQAKLDSMRRITKSLDIEIIGLKDLNMLLPEIDENGGKLQGRYKNAIWFIVDDGIHFCSMDETLATEPFLLVEKAHEKLVQGFPLDSLSIDIATGKYYYDMEEKSVDQSAIEMGFKEFFSKAFSELDLNNRKRNC